jgi:nucleoporin POM152
VRYEIATKGGSHMESVRVPGLRHQLELKPKDAGHFKYRFISIDDAVYKGHQLGGKDLLLEQDVKPPASAHLRRPSGTIDACIEEPVEMNVELSGEKPFTLEYELVHDGKRKKTKETGIETDVLKIQTDPLAKGGEYSLALTSIQDKTGCKIFLNSEVKFTVRRQRPKVSFGHLEGKHKTVEVEGRQVDLPLRLTGRSPWTIRYRNMNESSKVILEKTARSTNDIIRVNQRGTYEILDVSDDQCPGTVDPTASKFEVDWFPRPQIKLADTAVLIPEGKKFKKREVCEGDIDAVEVNLIGKSYGILFNELELTYQKELHHIMLSTKFVTSPSMDRAPFKTKNSKPPWAWPPSRWRPARPERTSTSSPSFPMAYTITKPKSSLPLYFRRKSIESLQRTSSNLDNRTSTAKKN